MIFTTANTSAQEVDKSSMTYCSTLCRRQEAAEAGDPQRKGHNAENLWAIVSSRSNDVVALQTTRALSTAPPGFSIDHALPVSSRRVCISL